MKNKSRAKKFDSNEWVFGHPCYVKGIGTWFMHRGENPNPVIQGKTIGLYAGVHDAEGNELDWWEGDIFYHLSGQCVIKWHEGGLYMHGSGGLTPLWDAAHWAVLPTKIGNIHDNPYLLKDDQRSKRE